MKYEIRISPEPSTHDSPNEPYFWWISEMSVGGEVCNTGLCGWAVTIDKAFKEAHAAWKQIKELKEAGYV